jgi:hypothetical protein
MMAAARRTVTAVLRVVREDEDHEGSDHEHRHGDEATNQGEKGYAAQAHAQHAEDERRRDRSGPEPAAQVGIGTSPDQRSDERRCHARNNDRRDKPGLAVCQQQHRGQQAANRDQNDSHTFARGDGK